MHRFYLAPADCHGTTLSLSGREAHHALHVLRVCRGEHVQVLDGEGHIFECEVTQPAGHRLDLSVLEHRSDPPLPYQITLAQAVPKGKLFEAIVQKATELGVFRIVPLVTDRVVGKIAAGEEDHKLEKWRLVAVEAIKQCGSAWLPRIESPSPIEGFLSCQPTMDLALVGSLRDDCRNPKRCFEDFVRARGKMPNSVSVAIGPEGDFTLQELTQLQSAGALPITLGPRVLRTETAALYCLAIINYELQQAPQIH